MLEREYRRAAFWIATRGALLSVAPVLLNLIFIIIVGHYFPMQWLDGLFFSFILGGLAGHIGIKVSRRYTNKKFIELHFLMMQKYFFLAMQEMTHQSADDKAEKSG